MEITYDKKIDALYIYFQKGKKIARTVELADLLLADLDRRGKIIGVEVLSPSRHITQKTTFKKGKKKLMRLFNVNLPLPAIR